MPNICVWRELWGDRGGKFCISGDLRVYQGSMEEWIGSFTGQDIANLPPRPTQSLHKVSPVQHTRFASLPLPNTLNSAGTSKTPKTLYRRAIRGSLELYGTSPRLNQRGGEK